MLTALGVDELAGRTAGCSCAAGRRARGRSTRERRRRPRSTWAVPRIASRSSTPSPRRSAPRCSRRPRTARSSSPVRSTSSARPARSSFLTAEHASAPAVELRMSCECEIAHEREGRSGRGERDRAGAPVRRSAGSTASELAAVCDVDDARAEKAGDRSRRRTRSPTPRALYAQRRGRRGRDRDAAGHARRARARRARRRAARVLREADQRRRATRDTRWRPTHAIGSACSSSACSSASTSATPRCATRCRSSAPVRRVHVTATNWLRAQQYFDASPWRATWRMAGGGVLMSQAVHQLDALIAAVGMPARVTRAGRQHRRTSRGRGRRRGRARVARTARGARVVASLTEPAGHRTLRARTASGGAITLADGYDVRVVASRRRAAARRRVPGRVPVAGRRRGKQIEVPRSKGEWFDMMKAAQREFAGAIAEQRPAAIDGDEGTKSVELANADLPVVVYRRGRSICRSRPACTPRFSKNWRRAVALPGS